MTVGGTAFVRQPRRPRREAILSVRLCTASDHLKQQLYVSYVICSEQLDRNKKLKGTRQSIGY